MDDRLMGDMASLDPIYADGELGFLNLGSNFLTCWYRWRPFKRDVGGALILERVPVLALVQPKASLAHPNGRRASILRAQPEPMNGLAWMMAAELH